MKVAIVHYWFITRRGGEKVVEAILKLYPQADIYTLFYDPVKYGDYISNHKIYTSSLNRPFLRKHYQKIFPLYPTGIRSLKLQEDYDLIISSESGPAKGIRINNKAPHICYIHSPMRYAWSHQEEYLSSVHKLVRPFMKFFLNRLKKWDTKTINNVDLYVANSENVKNRVKKYFHREAIVIHPPIEDALFQKPLEEISKDIYLSFGAITPYKRIDLLIEVFNKNKKKLVVIGDGSEKEKLEKMANSNIEFKSRLDWETIERYLAKTRALLFPGEEDFGMIPLEVMAYGIPVIAFQKGGALETVVENLSAPSESTGLFFEDQTYQSVEKAIQLFETIEKEFNPIFIRNHSKKFSEAKFLANFTKLN